MAASGKPPSSWDYWKKVKDNTLRKPIKLRVEFTAAEEKPLPAGVDKREQKIYTTTEDNLTGNKILDDLTKQLVKDYNTIAANRRDIIRRMCHAGKTECKGLPKALDTDVYNVHIASLEAKSYYRDLRRKGGRPVPFLLIFDKSIKAPKI